MLSFTYPGAELPRRAASVDAASLGYAGSPNAPAAPVVLRDMPGGTTYQDPSTGQWWIKDALGWALLADGLGLVSATQGNIVMRVDPVIGVSPAPGTYVHNQAEYDALGAPLKYCQDALDILPQFIDHGITVSCAAGEHLAKPGTMGTSPYAVNSFLRTGSHHSSANGVPNGNIPPELFGSIGVLFNGEVTIHQASISGSRTALRVFTAPGETWTINEHKGRFASFVSGSGAGYISVIVSNTADTLTIAEDFPAGASVIDITSPATVWLFSEDGITQLPDYGWSVGPGGGDESPLTIVYLFTNIQFGKPAVPWTFFQVVTSYYFIMFCRAFCYSPSGAQFVNSGWGSGYVKGDIIVANCEIAMLGGASLDAFGFGLFYMASSYMHGTASGRLMRLDSGATLSLYANTIEPVGAISAVYVNNGAYMSGNGNLFIGDGNCTGIRQALGTTKIRGFSADFQNCAVAVQVDQDDLNVQGTLTGAGNTVGWQVAGGARVNAALAGIGATTAVLLDGVAKTYAGDWPTAGTEVVGTLNSRIRRKA